MTDERQIPDSLNPRLWVFVETCWDTVWDQESVQLPDDADARQLPDDRINKAA